MESIGINFGSIVLLAIVFYFVIKSAVKNGINESYLFSPEQRKKLEYKELEDSFKQIGEEVPDFMRKE